MKILNKIALVSMLIAFTACESDFLDVNSNPNTSVEAPADQLFTGAIVETINNRTQYVQQYGNYYTQHFYSGNDSGFLTDWERYRETATLLSIWSNNFWNSYTNITALRLADETAFEGGFFNTSAQAKILIAEIYLELSLLHEDIPFTEANTIGITDPNFDDQETIFNGIIGILDEAIALIDVTTGGQVSGGDFFYNGNMTRWLKFANSMKFKMIMLKAEADPGAGAELATFMATNPILFESNADDAKVDFPGETGNQNPGWVLFEAFGAWNFQDRVNSATDAAEKEGLGYAMYLSPVSLSILENYVAEDPRLELFFRRRFDEPAFETLDINEDSDTEASYVDDNIYQAIYPDYFMTYSELQLLIAEAITRGFIAGDAQTAYENGARASIERVGALAQRRAATGIDAYINSLPDLAAPTSTTNATTALEHIYLQQFADSYLRGLKGWTDYRRTGYPALTPHPEGTIGGVIKRWPYDQDEPQINSNFPDEVAALGDPMWFEN